MSVEDLKTISIFITAFVSLVAALIGLFIAIRNKKKDVELEAIKLLGESYLRKRYEVIAEITPLTAKLYHQLELLKKLQKALQHKYTSLSKEDAWREVADAWESMSKGRKEPIDSVKESDQFRFNIVMNVVRYIPEIEKEIEEVYVKGAVFLPDKITLDFLFFGRPTDNMLNSKDEYYYLEQLDLCKLQSDQILSFKRSVLFPPELTKIHVGRISDLERK